MNYLSRGFGKYLTYLRLPCGQSTRLRLVPNLTCNFTRFVSPRCLSIVRELRVTFFLSRIQTTNSNHRQ